MFNAPTHEIQQIAILGGGTAGWMTAAALAQLLPKQCFSIVLVESESIGTVGVGEATLPHLRFFNQRLGIDEAEFIQATQATFKVGIEFSNWGQLGDAYIHPFGDYGKALDDIPFHQHFYAQHGTNPDANLDQYSLPVMACKAQKFAFPDVNDTSVKSSYSYAYHIDASRYASFLRDFAEQRKVERIEGMVTDVVTRVSDGAIQALNMKDGRRIEADFFIDCSGFRGQLIEQTLHAGYEDWSHWLPCNRAVAIPCEQTQQPLPYTKAIAREAGWQWQIPLNHRVGNGYVYCDQYIDQQQALDRLLQSLPGKPTAEPNHLRFLTGKRKVSWSHNCVAIGLSSGFLEPLESTSIYLIQAAIMKLVELIPQRANLAVKAKEYNRHFDHEMERIRDFLILHYHATERDDTDFWNYCRTMSIPQSLSDKMALYAHCGVIEDYRYGLFLVPSWLSVYHGQRIRPLHLDPRIPANRVGTVREQLLAMESTIAQVVEQMPSHSYYLTKIHNNTNPKDAISPHRPAQFSLYGGRQ